MKIPTYQSSVGIQNGSGGSGGQYQPVSAFMRGNGEAMPGALEHFARGLNKLNATVHGINMEERQAQLELDVLKDMQDFQAEASTWHDTYTKQYKGADARDAEAQAQAFYQEKLQGLNEKWAGNKYAARYIQMHGGQLANHGVNAMRDYATREGIRYGDEIMGVEESRALQIMTDPNKSQEERDTAWNSYNTKIVAWQRRKGTAPEAIQLRQEQIYNEAVGKRQEKDFLSRITNKDIGGAAAVLQSMQMGDAAGFAAGFESGPEGSAAIGYDKNGGTSYGKFQISSKAGTFPAFLQWLDKNGHEAVAEKLRASGPADTGSRKGQAPEVWRGLVASGEITDDMQTAFIKESHIDPAMAKLPQDVQKAILSNPDMYRAFFSTAVQHGADGAVKLITRNWEKAGGDKGAFLDALYADRKTQFASSTGEVQASAAARFDRERASLGAATVSPEKIGAYQNMLQTATREQQREQRTAAVEGIYSGIKSQIAELPLEEQNSVAATYISGIQDPEVRQQVKSQWDADMGVQKMLRDANDMLMARQFRDYVKTQNLLPSQALVVLDNTQGFSEEGREGVRRSLSSDAQKVTPENTAKLNALRAKIDRGEVDNETQIDAYAFDGGLTDKQVESARKYMDDGGNAGKVSITKVEGIFKRMGQGKKMPVDLYDMVLSNLEPGKPATDERIRQTIANLYMDGTTKGSGWFSDGETYADAVRNNRAAEWLPDVTKTEKQEITAILRGQGVTVTDERIRQYKKTEMMKIPSRSAK